MHPGGDVRLRVGHDHVDEVEGVVGEEEEAGQPVQGGAGHEREVNAVGAL